VRNLERLTWPGGSSAYTGLWLLVALLALGIIGNMLQLSVLFNVYFVFGSVAVMLAIAWLGTWPAVLVGITAGLYTYLIWQNPVTVVVFLLEAIVVSWIYHHKIKNRRMQTLSATHSLDG